MFKLTLVTPEKRVVVDQPVQKLTVPGYAGELDILTGHAPLLTTLMTGIVRWQLASETKENAAVVNWGYCEIHPTGVEILVDKLDFIGEVTTEQAQEWIDDGEKQLLNNTLTDLEWDHTQREVMRGRIHLESKA